MSKTFRLRPKTVARLRVLGAPIVSPVIVGERLVSPKQHREDRARTLAAQWSVVQPHPSKFAGAWSDIMERRRELSDA